MSAATASMEVPESQRLIAVSLGKIAASRGQKGGINLHRNLLVATVLHKARTAYMIQHLNAAKQQQQQQQQQQTPAVPETPSATPTSQCVEMADDSSSSSVSTSSSSSSSTETAAPTFQTAPTTTSSASSSSSTITIDTIAAPSRGVAYSPETGSGLRGGSAVEGGPVQVASAAECEDKENTPPPSPSPLRDAAPTTNTNTTTTTPAECEKRLQEGGQTAVTGDHAMDSTTTTGSNKDSCVKSSRLVSHAARVSRDYVSGQSCGSCVLKRRRAMDKDCENVSPAPKVRIVESRLSVNPDSAPEAMQCDSPQISNLVNIFNTSFAGLSGAQAGADMSVRSSSVGQSVLSSVSAHKLAENVTYCSKEMKFGLDTVRPQSLVLSV